MTTAMRYVGLFTGPQPTNQDVGTCSEALAVPVLPARVIEAKGKAPAFSAVDELKLGKAVPSESFTAPSKPSSMAWWSAGDSTTWPATLGAKVFTTFPAGVTIPAA